MRQYLDFAKEITKGTELQRSEAIKKWILSEVELTGTIWEVGEQHIQLIVPENPTGHWTLVFPKEGNDAQFRVELLPYSIGDKVRIAAQINRWGPQMNMGRSGAEDYRLDLVSISIVCKKK